MNLENLTLLFLLMLAYLGGYTSGKQLGWIDGFEARNKLKDK